MKRQMRHSLLTLGCVFVMGMATPPATLALPSPLITDPALAAPDLGRDWYTLPTPHFNIHYEAEHAQFATRLAAIAERVHNTLAPRAGYAPDGMTEIVINDSIDISNGAATVLPYRQFFIYMTPPNSGELLDDADWVEMVFTHEYMHVLHMDQAAGFPGGVRKVLGRWFFTFPQIFNPSWVTEGYAVWAETDVDKEIGRGQSALYDGMMRAEVMNGLKGLSSLSFHGYSGTDWPYGQSYLYGIYFFQFVEATWGKDKVREFIAAWNRNIIPFRMDGRAYQVFGMNAETLHARYGDWLKQRFEPEIERIRAQQRLATQVLAGDGHRENIRADGSGGVYFYESNGRSAPVIRHQKADGSIEALVQAPTLQQFDVHPTAGVVMSALRICDNTSAYGDLYRLVEGDWEAITECGRYISGYWSPAGDRLAAVAVEGGRHRLELLSSDGKRLQLVYEAPLGETLGEVDWHPQGSELVVARKPMGERWGLYRFTLASGEWQRLPVDDRLLQSPRYSPAGDAIYFIGDRQHALNVERYDFGSGRVDVLGQTLTAVTGLDVAADRLALLEYDAKGIAVGWLPMSPPMTQDVSPDATGITTTESVQAPFTPPINASAFTLGNAQPYEPWPTLAPTSWIALLGSDGEENTWVQLMSSGSDVLGYHAWQLAPRLYLDQSTLGGDLAYVFHRRLALLGSRIVTTEEEYEDDIPDLLEVEDRTQLVWMQPINNYDAAWQLNLGVAQESVDFWRDHDVIQEAYDANLGGLSLMVDSTDFYRQSISPEDGRRIKLTTEKYDALGGGLYRGNSYALDWNEFITTWPNQVLALRWVEARADDEARPFELGGNHDSFETLAGLIGFGKTHYALRGYDTGIDVLAGDNLRLQTLEYRLPVARIFDGFMAPPIGIGKIAATVFYDRGSAWNDEAERRYYAGAGAELSTDILLGYNLMSLDVTVGAATGLDDELGTNEVYVRLGAAF